MIRLDGENGAYPVQVNEVSGFMLKKGWPVPLLLSGPNGWIPLPVFLSFARMNSVGNVEKTKKADIHLYFFVCRDFKFGAGLFGRMGVRRVDMAVLAVLGHEGIYLGTKWMEKRSTPYFVSNHQGVKVLAVIPDSPAEAMGLELAM